MPLMRRPPPSKGRPAAPMRHAVSEVLAISPSYEEIVPELKIVRGFNPLPPEKARWLIGGLKGGGKTRLVSFVPNILMLDFENTVCNVDGTSVDYVYVKSLAHLEKILTRLQREKDNPTWQAVAFDPVDGLQDLVARHLTAEKNAKRAARNMPLLESIYEYGEKGKGYDLVASKLASLVLPVAEWGYGLFCTMHLQWTTVSLTDVTGKTEQVDRLKPSMYRSSARQIKNICDFLLHVERSVSTKSERDASGKVHRTNVTQVRALTAVNNKNQKGEELSVRIALPSEIALPRENPWEAIRTAWAESVQQIRAGR